MASSADSSAAREDFDRLLGALDRDRNRAAEVYESLRRHLATYFRLQGFHEAYDLVDRSLDIAARRLGQTRVENAFAYITGIARKVCLEAAKERRTMSSLDHVAGIPQVRADDADFELVQNCLEECVAGLSASDRKLILDYYTYSPGQKAASRLLIATSRGSSGSALRVKAHRVRLKLEACVKVCMRRHETPWDSCPYLVEGGHPEPYGPDAGPIPYRDSAAGGEPPPRKTVSPRPGPTPVVAGEGE